MEIRMYLYGSGESLGKVKGTADLRGYDIVSAFVDRNSGYLNLSVKPNNSMVVLGKGYVCYSNGVVKKDDKKLKRNDMVKISTRVWKQDEAILRAFYGDPPIKDCKSVVVHLNGDKNDNRLENLRWQ